MKPWCWLIIVFFCITPIVRAEVWLNEISAGSSPEYVELYNSTTEIVELSNWYLDDIQNGGSSPKQFSLTLNANSFGVIELNSIFNNTGGDSVRLLDQNQVEIDRYDYNMTVSLNDIFIRCPDGGEVWILTKSASRAQTNNPDCLTLTPTFLPELTIFPSVTFVPTSIPSPSTSYSLSPISTPTFTPEIILSEVMAYPDNDSEWVELYNPHSDNITLTDWFLDDQENSGSAPKRFSLTIAGKSFGTIYLSSQIFNNTSDQVRLLDSQLKEVDRFEYEKTTKNQTFARVLLKKDGYWCNTEPTPNQANSECLSSEKEIVNLATTAGLLLTPVINPTKAAILGSTLILPNPTSLHFSGNLYLLPKPKVLGAQKTQSHPTLSELVFWQQFTKISLWLNLVINTALLIYLSSSLLLLYR